MGFAEINEEIRVQRAKAGGAWVKLNRKEHGKLKGKLVDIEKRKKIFEKKEVLNQDGKNRWEWVVTLRVGDEIKKFAANESAQWALRGALKDGESYAEGGDIEIFVIEDPENSRSQAEYKVIYSPPVKEFPVDDDEPPY